MYDIRHWQHRLLILKLSRQRNEIDYKMMHTGHLENHKVQIGKRNSPIELQSKTKFGKKIKIKMKRYTNEMGHTNDFSRDKTIVPILPSLSCPAQFETTHP